MLDKYDWNYERYRTRDLLLEYDKAIMPPRPRAAGLATIYNWGEIIPSTDVDTILPPSPIPLEIKTVYPWENEALSIFSHKMYMVAVNNGFYGTEKEFFNNFINYVSEKEIIFDSYDNFPSIGSKNYLYFDLEEKVLYYWDKEYIPVNALLIENTTLDTGSSTESVE